jgi:hypothetical protein
MTAPVAVEGLGPFRTGLRCAGTVAFHTAHWDGPAAPGARVTGALGPFLLQKQARIPGFPGTLGADLGAHGTAPK